MAFYQKYDAFIQFCFPHLTSCFNYSAISPLVLITSIHVKIAFDLHRRTFLSLNITLDQAESTLSTQINWNDLLY